MLIDTHSHLYASQFDEDRKQEIQRCLDLNIKKVLLPNIDKESITGMHQLAENFPGVCYPMMGVHPCSILPDTWQDELSVAKKHLDAKTQDYIAIGEIGIDLYWDKSTLGIQREAFAEQIKWAKDFDLPIVIHARDSFDEIFEVIDLYNDERLRGVFHCFTGTSTQAQRIIDYSGFLMGIGGVVTFKNSGLDKAIAGLDLKHFVLETDAPYLAPTPKRGKRNQSSYIPLIADKLAAVFNCDYDTIARVTTENAQKMFNLAN